MALPQGKVVSSSEFYNWNFFLARGDFYLRQMNLIFYFQPVSFGARRASSAPVGEGEPRIPNRGLRAGPARFFPLTLPPPTANHTPKTVPKAGGSVSLRLEPELDGELFS